MLPHCLNHDELKLFFETEFQGRDIPDDYLEFIQLFESWKDWGTELICLTTVFSRFLEQLQKADEDVERFLHSVFSLSETSGHWILLEGFDADFVSYIFRHTRDSNFTIDEDLNYIRSQFAEHEY